MPARGHSLEEGGKDSTNPAKPVQVRALPWRFLLLLGLFLGISLVISFISMVSVRRLGGLTNFVAMAKPAFLPCGDPTIHLPSQATTLDEWIMPPSNLLHSMSDEELSWRATFTPRIDKFPYKRIPKIAFMFLTKGPMPFSPLWERFFKGHEKLYSIYIHALPSYHDEFPSTSVFYKRYIPSKLTEWGQMSMCDSEKRLLANALLDISNEWFILLSESCIPLFNFTSIYKYISRSRHSFVGSFDDEGRDGRGRYNESMAPLVNLTQWRKGAQWFQVNRKLAIDIVVDSTYYPIFKEFCKPRCYPDEHYIPTMLNIIAPDRIANRSLTWVDWSRGGAHPAMYEKTELNPEFFKRISEGNGCFYNGQHSSVCFLFARKFSPSTLEPLLSLASEVFHF